MRCITCSYDLKSLSTCSCPECGRVFDRNDPSTFDTRTRMQRLLIRIAASLAVSALSLGVMIVGAWIASGIAFSTFNAAVGAYLSVGVACAMVTAAAAACIRSWIARAILLVAGVLCMWPMLLLGFDRGYRVWQAQPDAPEEAFADGGPIMGAIFLGWIPSGMWWLAVFGIALLVVHGQRRRSKAPQASAGGMLATGAMAAAAALLTGV